MPIRLLHSTLRQHPTGHSVVEERGRAVSGPEDLVSPISRRGYGIWQEACGGEGKADVADLTPERLVSILPYVYLVDVLSGEGERDFRYRLVGTDIVSHTEADNTGRRLSEISWQGSQATLIRLYDLATQSGVPSVQRIAYPSKIGSRLWYETLVMPMAVEPKGPVTRLLGVAEHFSQSV